MYSLRALRRDAIRKIRQEGLFKALLHSYRGLLREIRPVDDPFDEQHGTDTAREVSVGALELPNEKMEGANRYQSTRDTDGFHALIQNLGIDYSQFTFIDIGSGKGRCLLLASSYPFRRIIGVEFSPVLHEIALKNIAIYKSPDQHCRDITSVCADALEFELPKEPIVLYMFNPFSMAVMQPFAKRVTDSLWVQPREVYVAYRQPSCRSAWDELGWKTLDSTNGWVIYKAVP